MSRSLIPAGRTRRTGAEVDAGTRRACRCGATPRRFLARARSKPRNFLGSVHPRGRGTSRARDSQPAVEPARGARPRQPPSPASSGGSGGPDLGDDNVVALDARSSGASGRRPERPPGRWTVHEAPNGARGAAAVQIRESGRTGSCRCRTCRPAQAREGRSTRRCSVGRRRAGIRDSSPCRTPARRNRQPPRGTG